MSDRSDTFPDLTAVLLAGGLGTRIRQVLPEYPKVLAPVNGRPFILYLLDQLAASGIGEVILCTGYLAEKVQQEVGKQHGRMRVRYSTEEEPLGTAGAARLAMPLIQTDYIMVLNGDSYVDADLPLFIDRFRSGMVSAAMLLVEVADTHRYGRVEFDRHGEVTAFHEKDDSTGPGWINAGIYLFRTGVLNRIPPGKFVSMEKDIFPELVHEGILGCTVRREFIDIGIPQTLAAAGTFFDDIFSKKGR